MIEINKNNLKKINNFLVNLSWILYCFFNLRKIQLIILIKMEYLYQKQKLIMSLEIN